jgi:hypothetical protein
MCILTGASRVIRFSCGLVPYKLQGPSPGHQHHSRRYHQFWPVPASAHGTAEHSVKTRCHSCVQAEHDTQDQPGEHVNSSESSKRLRSAIQVLLLSNIRRAIAATAQKGLASNSTVLRKQDSEGAICAFTRRTTRAPSKEGTQRPRSDRGD